ncbi:hypothetical protein N665_0218s0033 [Sinapis alba]|nr:hypothetical protein N665_0218s0033 [Sinapis alba]
MQNGQHSVEIPDEVLDSATPLWKDFLVGKFLSTAPHISKVHVIVNKIWNQSNSQDHIDVYEVNPTVMRFRVRSPQACQRTLRRGMWNIAEVPLIVQKWNPKTEAEHHEEKAILMWVHLKKVPMHMYSWEGLSFISSTVGHPVRLHPESASCSNFDIGKIFVNVDVSKELPRSIKFSKNCKDFMVDFIYPWLPPIRCSYYKKMGSSKEGVCGEEQK